MSRSQELCKQGQVIYLSGLPTKIVGEDEADKAKLLCTLCCCFACNSVGANQHVVHTTPVHLLVICTSCYTTWTQIKEVLLPIIPAHHAYCSNPSSCQQHFLLHHLNTDSRSLSAYHTSTSCILLQSIFLSTALPVTPPEHRFKKP